MIKPISYYVLVLVLCGSIACEKDKGPAPLFREIDLGSLTLLQSSIDALPYPGKSGAVYQDSTGAEILFEISEKDIVELSFAGTKYDMYAPGDTVRYLYRPQQKEYMLRNESLDITVLVRLRAVPYYSFPEPGLVADELSIQLLSTDSTFMLYLPLFSVIVDQRSWPRNTQALTTFPEVDIFGKVFYNAMQRFLLISGSSLATYFNFEFGLISFEDYDGRQWRFERWE
jgi:hypothetical protein